MRRPLLRLPYAWFGFFACFGVFLALSMRRPLCAWAAAFSFGLITARLLGLVESVAEDPGPRESSFTWRHQRTLELLSLAALPIVLPVFMSIDGPIPLEPVTVAGALGLAIQAVFAFSGLLRLWRINRRP